MSKRPTADTNGYIQAHGIFVKAQDAKRGEWLTSNYTTTTRRVHAALARTIPEYEKLERAVADLIECNPGESFELRPI